MGKTSCYNSDCKQRDICQYNKWHPVYQNWMTGEIDDKFVQAPCQADKNERPVNYRSCQQQSYIDHCKKEKEAGGEPMSCNAYHEFF